MGLEFLSLTNRLTICHSIILITLMHGRCVELEKNSTYLVRYFYNLVELKWDIQCASLCLIILFTYSYRSIYLKACEKFGWHICFRVDCGKCW